MGMLQKSKELATIDKRSHKLRLRKTKEIGLIKEPQGKATESQLKRMDRSTKEP